MSSPSHSDTNSDPQSDSTDSSSSPINMKIDVGTNAPMSPDEDGPALPFRLVLVSNLTPHAHLGDGNDKHHRYQIGDKSVADVMAEVTPTLSIEVPNTLSSNPDAWTVDLSFPTLSAFEPQHLAQQLDATDKLLDARDLLRAAEKEEIDAEAFDQRLNTLGFDIDWAQDLYRLLTSEAKTEAPSQSGPDSPDPESGALDRVFNMVDTDEMPPSGSDNNAEQRSADEKPDGPLGNALEAGRRAEDNAAEHIIGRLTEALQAQVKALLHHPAVRELESAWRGLSFLRERIDLDAPVELTVLPARPEALDEAVHDQILVPEHSDANEEPPVSMILVDHAFGREHVDMEQLADLAATGQSLQTPVVASVGPDFFGMESLQGLEQLPSLRPHMQGPEHIEWKRLRNEDTTAFLGLALPPLQLRPSYTDDASPIGVPEDNALYGNGALAVGVAAARSFAETGWPTHLTDYLVPPPSTAATVSDAPLAASLSGSMQSELARAGFVVADTLDDRPGLQLAYASSVREPDSYTDPAAAAEARKRLTLPCQLFAGRAAHRVLDLKRSLDWTQPLEAVCEDVAATMANFLQIPRDEADVQLANDAVDGEDSATPFPPVLVEEVDEVDLPEQVVLAVRIRPPEHVLGPNARLAMALRPPKATS